MSDNEFEDITSDGEDNDAGDDEVGSGVDGEGTEDGTEGTEDADFLDDDAATRFGHLARSVYSDLSPADQIAKWHGSLLPIEVDLITELDGVNLFFINVESVIIDLLLSKEVAFIEDTQFLRMMFAMEQLLYAIKSSGGSYRLIFFDGMQKVFSAAYGESVWAFRQAFLCHCRSAGIDHAVFSHWYSAEWKEHIDQWRPSFFLVADDAIPLEDDEEEEEEPEEDEKPKLREMFRALTLSCLSLKSHAALLHGVQRRGNRMMAFTLEPDCYDGWVDHNVQADLLPLFNAEDDEEEDEAMSFKGAVIPEIQKFQATCKVKDSELLRSFFTAKFCRETLTLCTGENAASDQLMRMVVKTMVLQELMIRQIPLDKRAYSVPDMSDWEFFEERISAGLDRYFTMIAKGLGKLQTEEVPEGVCLETCDLFDGRLYRHLFQVLVMQGLKEKGKITAEFFNMQKFVTDELETLWKQVDSKDKFFPVDCSALLEFPGLAPPDMPAQEKPRPKPTLQANESDFLKSLWKDFPFSTITDVDVGEAAQECCLWSDPYNWNEAGAIDSLKQEEHMEENEAEKKFRLKMAAKGKKLSGKDIEWQRKFQLKKKQMALKALAGYAKSLTGSDKLHPPIIMKEGKQEEAKAPAEVKLGAKQVEIMEKIRIDAENKVKAHDAEQSKNWDKPIELLSEVMEPEKFEKDLLDLVCGFTRITDGIMGFPAISGALKTKEAQSKLVVKVVKACSKALKKMKLDSLPANQQNQVRRIVNYFYCVLQEGYNSYGKDNLDGKAIKLFQESLIGLGFPKCATDMFQRWKKAQLDKAEKSTAAEGPADAGKGTKDDKKKGGKDDKKSDKKDDKKAPAKDDKKDKKDDKKDKKGGKDDKKGDEAGDAADPDSFEVKKEVESLWSGVGPDEKAAQMLHLGPYMARTVGTAKDPLGRVNFKPDGWQKNLLDIVDENKSALIVAPTASGKTFIGYYVMDKVLRADNEGVAVYVAPSKALVNQVSAEVYARFSSKTYPANSKNELLGVFLREFNSAGGAMEQGKWKNCQVLVTIPHILEMLLASPGSQDWVKRLRYVIFDEVHCIGEQEGGAQWEHSMQAIPCPFIALSATVADPSFFHDWLNKVAEKKGQAEVKLVKHTERWNDLYKYVFSEGQLKPLHPFCCLIEQSVRRNGFASDLTLTPGETCQLYTEVAKILGPKNEAWSSLAPSKYFVGDKAGYITKGTVRTYEGLLKDAFLKILRNDTLSSAGFEQLVMALQQMPALEAPKADDKKFAPPPRADAGDGDEDKVTDFRTMSKRSTYLQGANMFSLCKTLEKGQQLPALVFNFSTKEIESMLKRMVKELKDQQYMKYYGDEDATYKSKKVMEKRHAAYEQAKTAYEQAQKANASKNQQGKAMREQDGDDGKGKSSKESVDVGEDATMAEPEPVIDIADEIDMEFSFHSPKALGQWQEDIKDEIKQLKRRGIPQVLIDGLQRGIGMHHEGCKTRYKQAVEIFFRRGYLRVVFATGTLALGINMPCRSTIFCGDSLDLNGLMFRQMSGRAGRRGFDLLGQVVFLDMSFLKVRRLIASDLSSLTGEFQLSPTTLLRVLQCWEKYGIQREQALATKGEGGNLRSLEDVARTFSTMFSLPFFRSELAALDTQVAYHTRFSVELLRKEGLITDQGSTKNLSCLVSHLFEIEPANFILGRLLVKGLLHAYLKKAAKSVVKSDRRTALTVKLTQILSWFMFRKRLPASYTKSQPRKKWLPSTNCPALPPLPDDILKEVRSYNLGVFELFQELAWSVASTRKFGDKDFTLPCSRRHFAESWDERGAPFNKESVFQAAYIKQLVRFRARSPLSAISGAGDSFASPTDLVASVRNVIQMDLNSLPIIPPATGELGRANGELEATNSWMLDFMMHGKLKYLADDNNIDGTKAYKLIKGFEAAIKMAVEALKTHCPTDDIVLKTFQDLHVELVARSPK